jgi:hypothetical protein
LQILGVFVVVNRGEFVVACVANCGGLHHAFPMTKNTPLICKLFFEGAVFQTYREASGPKSFFH